MKVANVELNVGMVELLAKGKHVTIKLPDAEVRLTASADARADMALNTVANSVRDILNKTRGKKAQ